MHSERKKVTYSKQVTFHGLDSFLFLFTKKLFLKLQDLVLYIIIILQLFYVLHRETTKHFEI